MSPVRDGDYIWSGVEKAARTKEFLGMSRLLYHDCEVRILSVTENAVACKDAGGHTRIVLLTDMSWASQFVARDNTGAVVMLKIRKWAA